MIYTYKFPQSQHSHLVIQQLLGHLDANSKSSARVRAGIVEVLSEAAVIEASGSIGRGVAVHVTTTRGVCGALSDKIPRLFRCFSVHQRLHLLQMSVCVSDVSNAVCCVQGPPCWRCSIRC